jgi:cytidyltransferase-like protein
MKKIIITSGYFNPLHIGHVNLLRGAKNLGDFLIVIVNNDKQVKLKGSAPFMPEKERMEIIKSIRHVDEVLLAVDKKDTSSIESLKTIAKKFPKDKLFYAKGGDRHSGNIPEAEICRKLNIKIINHVGGGKVQSSSWLIDSAKKL